MPKEQAVVVVWVAQPKVTASFTRVNNASCLISMEQELYVLLGNPDINMDKRLKGMPLKKTH